MSDTELDHLLQMLGDIERNLAFNSDAEQRIAEHLRRYWAPSMRTRILNHLAAGGAGINELSQRALARLKLSAGRQGT